MSFTGEDTLTREDGTTETNLDSPGNQPDTGFWRHIEFQPELFMVLLVSSKYPTCQGWERSSRGYHHRHGMFAQPPLLGQRVGMLHV